MTVIPKSTNSNRVLYRLIYLLTLPTSIFRLEQYYLFTEITLCLNGLGGALELLIDIREAAYDPLFIFANCGTVTILVADIDDLDCREDEDEGLRMGEGNGIKGLEGMMSGMYD
jgi:hypothetical protein